MGKSSAQIDVQRAEECRRRQQPIRIPRADAFDCRQAGGQHGWPAASASFDPRLSLVRSAISSRERRSSIRGCSGWGRVEGLKNLLFCLSRGSSFC